MVTSASRGLGRALTLAFAEEGANLVINSRNSDALDPVAKEAEDVGTEVLAYRSSVACSRSPLTVAATRSG